MNLIAQCCADGMHCCPNQTECNDKEGSCDRIHREKQIVEPMLDMGHMCPDKNKTCSQSETCCKLKTGGYGCCFYSSG